MQTDRGWKMCKNTAKHEIMFSAALYVARQHLGLEGCLAVTVAQGIRSLPASASVIASITMHWIKEQAEEMQYYEQDGCNEIKMDSDQIRGRNWPRACVVQFRCFSEQRVAEARRESEDR